MNIVIFTAHELGVPVAEAITSARHLAANAPDPTDIGRILVVVGPRLLSEPQAEATEPSATELAMLHQHGADELIVVPATTAAGFATVVAHLARQIEAEAILAPSSFTNKEIAAGVAQRLEIGLLIDVAELSFAEQLEPPAPRISSRGDRSRAGVQGRKRVFAGTWQTIVDLDRSGFVATLRPNSIAAAVASLPPTQTIRLTHWTDPIEEARITVIDRRPISSGTNRPALAEAAVVVAGGRGTMGDFTDLTELADLLGAALGTTRDAVEEEWLTHDLQIGQTGVTVAPRLYIGAGISGAPHHVGGMQESGTIVAINTDSEAPLMELADIAVVDDLASVVSELNELIRAHFHP